MNNHFKPLIIEFQETVAELLCLEKSTILSQVASDSIGDTAHPTRSAPGGPAEKNGRNMEAIASQGYNFDGYEQDG